MTAPLHWRGWTLSSRDGDWLVATRRIGDVLHKVMVRPKTRGGFRAVVERETWPRPSTGRADAETAEAALDAAARAAGMVL